MDSDRVEHYPTVHSFLHKHYSVLSMLYDNGLDVFGLFRLASEIVLIYQNLVRE